MLLTQLKQYLMMQRQASLLDLMMHFNVEENVMRSMVSIFIRKGQLQEKPLTNRCGSKCSKCQPATTTVYEWLSLTSPLS